MKVCFTPSRNGDSILLPVFPFAKNKKKNELRNSSDPSSGLTGLEPAASALTGRCSDQLNYNPSEVYSIHILMVS